MSPQNPNLSRTLWDSRPPEIIATAQVLTPAAASTPGGSGAATPAGASSLYTAKPKTKDDFAALAKLVTSEITSRHASNPLYATFVEALAKELCEGLNAVQTRKVSSALSVLGNTKQAEERDKASGKKKVSSRATRRGIG